MGNLSRGLLDYLWQQGWQVGGLVLIVAGVCVLLRHRSSHLRYLLWLVVLAKALVPPLFTFALPILPGRASDAIAVMEPSNLGGRPSDQARPLDRMVQPADLTEGQVRGIQAKDILAWIWLTGAAALGCTIGIKAVRLHRLLVSHRSPLPEDLLQSIEAFQSAQGLSRPARVWVCPAISQPLVWGLYRGQIYLPIHLTGADHSQEQRMVLAHEVCHVLRFDPLMNGLQILVQIVYWFHPLVWWANRRIRVEREKCCDEMAIAWMHTNGRDYSHALLNTLIAENTRHMALPSLAVAGPVKCLEERIGDLMRRKTFHTRPSLSDMAAVLLLALIVVPSSVVLSHQQTPVRPPSTRPQVPQIGPNTANVLSEPNEETILKTRTQRASQVQRLGNIIVQLFAEDNGKTLPVSLKDVQPYCDPNLYQWAQTNVEYIGRGRSLGQSKTPIAFDQGLLPEGQGTIVLFADAHVEYRRRPDLESLGIIDPNAQFAVAWSIIRAVGDDKSLMAFLRKNAPLGHGTLEESIWTLSNEQAQRFRQMALASPQSKCLASPRVTVRDRGLGRTAMVYKEASSRNGQPDPNRTPGVTTRFWCTKGGQDLVRTYMDWKIVDEMSPESGTIGAPVIVSEGTCTVASRPGDWVVVPGASQGQRYFVMCQVTTPSRPINNKPTVNNPSSEARTP